MTTADILDLLSFHDHETTNYIVKCVRLFGWDQDLQQHPISTTNIDVGALVQEMIRGSLMKEEDKTMNTKQRYEDQDNLSGMFMSLPDGKFTRFNPAFRDCALVQFRTALKNTTRNWTQREIDSMAETMLEMMIRASDGPVAPGDIYHRGEESACEYQWYGPDGDSGFDRW